MMNQTATTEREQRQEVLPHPKHVSRQDAIRAAHKRARDEERRRGWGRDYPRTAMIDAGYQPDPVLNEAVRRFKRSKPFRLDLDGFARAAQRLACDVAEAFEMPAPQVDVSGMRGDGALFSQGSYEPHIVRLKGPPSVITLIHELIHAAGYGETGAVYHSVNLFRIHFPKSFARLIPVRGSHVLRRPPESARRITARARDAKEE